MSKLLGDRYLLGAMIGTGGMADVYTAQDQRLSREVAVKILRSDHSLNNHLQAALLRTLQPVGVECRLLLGNCYAADVTELRTRQYTCPFGERDANRSGEAIKVVKSHALTVRC